MHVKTLKSCRRAFTLTELAIVLGIVGVIMGGIYTASSSSQSQVILNQSVDQLGTIVNNVRSYYSGRQAPAPANCPASFASAYSLPPKSNGYIGWPTATGGGATASNAASLYNQAGIFPQEMLNTQSVTTGGTHYISFPNNLWNSASASPTVMVDFCQMSSAPIPFVSFAVHYAGLNEKNCMYVVTRTAGMASQTNLYQIIVSNPTAQTFSTVSSATKNGILSTSSTSTGGVSVINACTPATAGGTVSVDWYYKLNG